MTPTSMPTRAAGITFYGADWCPDSRRARALLDRLAIPYVFVDMDADERAADHARALHGGRRTAPTILLSTNGPVLFEPSDGELLAALRESGWTEKCETDRVAAND